MIPENTTQSELSRLDKRYRILLRFQRRITAINIQADIQENQGKMVAKLTTWQGERASLINKLSRYVCNRGVIIKSAKKPNKKGSITSMPLMK